jgi:Uncharacterized protein conserved in bacteria (DUF2320).
MMPDSVRRSLVSLLVLASPGAPAAVATTPAIDVTLGTSMGFDSNVYLAAFGRLANRESMVSTVSARFDARFDSGVALAYAATATEFWSERDENNIRQTLGAFWIRTLDALAWSTSTEFALVAGDDRGVDYGIGIGSAFSTAAPRERRDQWQNKTDLSLRHDSDLGFVRAIGNLRFWDMRTRPVASCDYVDRYDVQGGLDVGRALGRSGLETYFGYRRGRQFQDNDFSPSTIDHATNRYDRYLVGVDGSPAKSLKLDAQVGWAKHGYTPDYAGSAHEEGLFSDATVTWIVTPDDELQLKTGRSRTVATTGRNSILSTVHHVSWKHVFGPKWSTTLTGRVIEAEYAPFPRDDFHYAAGVSLTWNATQALRGTLSLSQDWGRNHLNNLSGLAEARREFDRTAVSVDVSWKL